MFPRSSGSTTLVSLNSPSRILPITLVLLTFTLGSPQLTIAEQRKSQVNTLGTYSYEPKPDDGAFTKFNPRLAPPPGPLLLRRGDRLAIIGDSITEQKIYSRIIETYHHGLCTPTGNSDTAIWLEWRKNGGVP